LQYVDIYVLMLIRLIMDAHYIPAEIANIRAHMTPLVDLGTTIANRDCRRIKICVMQFPYLPVVWLRAAP
jgi:hypothetical protein